MSVVAAYQIFMCALLLVQGGMWTPQTTHTQIYDMLPQHS